MRLRLVQNVRAIKGEILIHVFVSTLYGVDVFCIIHGIFIRVHLYQRLHTNKQTQCLCYNNVIYKINMSHTYNMILLTDPGDDVSHKSFRIRKKNTESIR